MTIGPHLFGWMHLHMHLQNKHLHIVIVTCDYCGCMISGEGEAGLRTRAQHDEGLAPHLVGCSGQPVDAVSDLVDTICSLVDVAGGPVGLCCRCLHRHMVSLVEQDCKADKLCSFYTYSEKASQDLFCQASTATGLQ